MSVYIFGAKLHFFEDKTKRTLHFFEDKPAKYYIFSRISVVTLRYLLRILGILLQLPLACSHNPYHRFGVVSNQPYKTVPLNDKALSLLPPKPEVDDGKPIFKFFKKNDSVTMYVRRIKEKAGIEDKDVTFHCSRHTIATLALQNSLGKV